MMRGLLSLFLCLAVVLGLSACGVKPKKLEGPSGFPATYPQE
jgi:predicted small lipoprotein YifL